MLPFINSFLILFSILCSPQLAQSGNILIMLMPEALSHRRTLYPIAESLQARGHRVTMAIPALSEPKLLSGKIEERFFHTKTKDQRILDTFVYGNATEWGYYTWEVEMNNALILLLTTYVMNTICLETIDQNQAEMKKLMQRHWDLILVDDLVNPCGASMASLSTAPYISLSTTLIFPTLKYFKGIPYNPATSAPVFYKFHFQPDQFWSRLQCVISYCSEFILTGVGYNLAALDSGRSLDSEKYQSFSRFLSNSDMLLTDYPNILEYPQPIRFDMFETGSYCSSKPKPLPEDFKRFVNDPRSKGTIYMAFGTHVKWSVAPKEKISVFKEAISRLKHYRIFWQYNGPKIDLPDHVIAQKWFPQLDILAHNKTIAFLSHGGLKSLREGMCQGVPTLVMPMFAEQYRNALILKAKKAGNLLDKLTLTPDSIETAIRSVVEDPEMMINMGNVRDFLQDQLLDGPHLAIFWSEFLIRHQGVPRLFFSKRSQQLWAFQYFMLDVMGVFLGSGGILIWSFYRAMKRFYMK